MSEIEEKIFRALADHFDAFVLANPIETAPPGVVYVPPEGSPEYLQVWYLPAEPGAIGLDTLNRHMGIFQIDVCWPDKRGIQEPIAKAGQVIRHFQRNTRMRYEGVGVKVSRAWHSAAQPAAAKWIKVPVSIRYEAFV